MQEGHSCIPIGTWLSLVTKHESRQLGGGRYALTGRRWVEATGLHSEGGERRKRIRDQRCTPKAWEKHRCGAGAWTWRTVRPREDMQHASLPT